MKQPYCKRCGYPLDDDFVCGNCGHSIYDDIEDALEDIESKEAKQYESKN